MPVRHVRSAPVVIELLLLGQLSRQKGFRIATPYTTGLPFYSFVVATHQMLVGRVARDQNLQTCEV